MADYRCCAVRPPKHAGIMRAARPRAKKKKKAKRIRAEADWRKGVARAVGTRQASSRETGVGCVAQWILLLLLSSPANSNIAPRALANAVPHARL